MGGPAPPTVLIASMDPAAAERLAVKAAGHGVRAHRVMGFGKAALDAARGGVDACVIDLGFAADEALNLAETLSKAAGAPPVIFVGYVYLKRQDDRWRAEALGRIPAGDDFISVVRGL